MDPTADGLNEINETAAEPVPAAPIVEEALAALVPTNGHVENTNGHVENNGYTEPNGNGHTETAIDGWLDQHRILQALQAMRVGDFSVRLPADGIGIGGKIADTFNEIVAANERMAQQLQYVGQVVGREGKTRQRVKFALPNGAWGEMESSVNALIDDLLWPTAAVTHAITAVARGDLLQTVRLDVDGRPLQGNSCGWRRSSTR